MSTFYSRFPINLATAGIQTINANTNAHQVIAAGTGITVSSSLGTTTIATSALAGNTVVNVSSNVTLTNKAIHFVDTSGARNLTLPAPSTSLYIVLKDSTGGAAVNNVTLIRPGAQKIETVAANYILDTTLFAITIVSNGTDYFLI